mgnify:CR=1 FL=1
MARLSARLVRRPLGHVPAMPTLRRRHTSRGWLRELRQLGLAVLILGTGAMGSAVAGLLAHHSRAEVTVAGRWTAALSAMREHGVVVEDGRPVERRRFGEVGAGPHRRLGQHGGGQVTALGDVAQSELLQPKARRQSAKDDSERPTLDLFGNE